METEQAILCTLPPSINLPLDQVWPERQGSLQGLVTNICADYNYSNNKTDFCTCKTNASQLPILRILQSLSQSRNHPPIWNPKFRGCFHQTQQFDPIVSQLNPVHIIIHYFFKIKFNIIFLSANISHKRTLLFMFLNKNFVCISHFFRSFLPRHPLYNNNTYNK